jgi:ABC-type sugar transport system permease subunit
MKPNKAMIISFLGPALLAFAAINFYPIIRTVYLSFFDVSSFAGADMKFIGLDNYLTLYFNPIFRKSFVTIGRIWGIGGAAIFGSAFLFTILLTSGIKGKGFFRAVIYLPNIIPVVAATAMWTQYIYNSRYGLFKTVFSALGWETLAKFQWTSSDMIFWAMLIAYVWGGIGWFMLIILAGVERIPMDLLEAAKLDGANAYEVFTNITLPLLRDVIRICVVMWTITVINLFAFPRAFTPVIQSIETTTPAIYLYQLAFGLSTNTEAQSQLFVGKAAAVGVILTLLVLLVYGIINIFFSNKEKLEY